MSRPHTHTMPASHPRATAMSEILFRFFFDEIKTVRIVAPATATDAPFRFSLTQRKIMIALVDGPLRGDPLARECGLENRSSLHTPNALRPLMSNNWVESNKDVGYQLTATGLPIAQQLAKEQPA